MSKIGDRVGAILGGEGEKIEFFGYGVYAGDFIPKEAVGFIAEVYREENIENPRIDLDNGTQVYDCECWWGPEELIKIRMDYYKAKGMEIVEVNINDVRKEWAEENGKG